MVSLYVTKVDFYMNIVDTYTTYCVTRIYCSTLCLLYLLYYMKYRTVYL